MKINLTRLQFTAIKIPSHCLADFLHHLAINLHNDDEEEGIHESHNTDFILRKGSERERKQKPTSCTFLKFKLLFARWISSVSRL
jgi:hypothetical protein